MTQPLSNSIPTGLQPYPSHQASTTSSTQSVTQPTQISQNQTYQPIYPKVKFNGRTYHVIPKDALNNPIAQNPGNIDPFARLIGITLKYSLAALERKVKDETKKSDFKIISLNNVRITQLIPQDNEGQRGAVKLEYDHLGKTYDIPIDDDFEIKKNDEDIQTLPSQITDDQLDTAKKTYEKALEILNSRALAPSETFTSNPVIINVVNYDNLSDKVKKKVKSDEDEKTETPPKPEDTRENPKTTPVNTVSQPAQNLQGKKTTEQQRGEEPSAATLPKAGKFEEKKSLELNEYEKTALKAGQIPNVLKTEGQKGWWKNYLLNGTLPIPDTSDNKFTPESSIQFTESEANKLLSKLANYGHFSPRLDGYLGYNQFEDLIFLKRLLILIKRHLELNQSADIKSEITNALEAIALDLKDKDLAIMLTKNQTLATELERLIKVYIAQKT